MDALLEKFYEDIESNMKNMFSQYIVKVSELNSSFFVLIKQYRGEVLSEKQEELFGKVKSISEDVSKDYATKSKDFERDFFPYFRLVKSYGNYQFHFLVIKKDYVGNRRVCHKTLDA